MGTGIWAIAYNLKDGGSQDYLTWFHEVHIPEKLSRPGYVWAAHFQSIDPASPRAGNLALFGGETTRTFFDPSPSQLKKRQDGLTRTMMGERVKPASWVYTLEWHQEYSGSCLCTGQGSEVRFIRMEWFTDPDNDEDLEVWCAQERTILASRLPGCLGSTKLLAGMGSPKHAMLFEFSDIESPEVQAFLSKTQDLRSQSPFSSYGVPFTGKRVWPSL